mmetsp:Transcript_19711/g.38158  ORF Transcript_19711/g.38158 Transcript_19711/m.38158 type:complete len:213 (+) Transcript_19711:354-992(+)
MFLGMERSRALFDANHEAFLVARLRAVAMLGLPMAHAFACGFSCHRSPYAPAVEMRHGEHHGGVGGELERRVAVVVLRINPRHVVLDLAAGFGLDGEVAGDVHDEDVNRGRRLQVLALHPSDVVPELVAHLRTVDFVTATIPSLAACQPSDVVVLVAHYPREVAGMPIGMELRAEALATAKGVGRVAKVYGVQVHEPCVLVRVINHQGIRCR